MSMLDKHFLDAYTPPNLISSKHKLMHASDVSKYLKSCQVIKLTQDEVGKLAKDNNFWFYEYDMEVYNDLENITKLFDDNQFDEIEDGYGISEYIGRSEKYFPSMDYLQYTKMNNTDVVVNVYDAYSLYDISRRNEILRDKISGQLLIRHNDDYDQTLPSFDFNIPENIKYTYFVKSKYEANVLVSCFQYPVHILSVNIPYSVYSSQPLPPSVYTWNIDTNEHRFGYMNGTDFNEMVNEIATNGIRKPIFMRLNGGVLSAVDDETNMILFIARLLHLPFIPVNIYLSNEVVGINLLIDAIVSNIKNKETLYRNITSMNNIFGSNILIHRPNDDMSKYSNINQYPIFSSDEYSVVRYYDSNIPVAIINNVNDEDIVNIHKQNIARENEKINNKINDALKKLFGE